MKAMEGRPARRAEIYLRIGPSASPGSQGPGEPGITAKMVERVARRPELLSCVDDFLKKDPALSRQNCRSINWIYSMPAKRVNL